MFEGKRIENLTLEQKLQILLDEREIRAVLYRSARAGDRVDAELLRSCYHDDAVDHHEPFFDLPVAEFLKGFESRMANVSEGHQYLMGNINIELDGDIAHTETYCWSATKQVERADNGDPLMRMTGCRYVDRFERRQNIWKIAERWYVPEWSYFVQVPPLTRRIGNVRPSHEIDRPPLTSFRDKRDITYTL